VQPQHEGAEIEPIRPRSDDLPSSTNRSPVIARRPSTTSGKYRSKGRWLREVSNVSSPARNATQRNPSHFGS
jgi:hypothetical protein